MPNAPEIPPTTNATGNPEKRGWVTDDDAQLVHYAASRAAEQHDTRQEELLRDLAHRIAREVRERRQRHQLGVWGASPEEVPAQLLINAGLNAFGLTLFTESYRKYATPPRLAFVYGGCMIAIAPAVPLPGAPPGQDQSRTVEHGAQHSG